MKIMKALSFVSLLLLSCIVFGQSPVRSSYRIPLNNIETSEQCIALDEYLRQKQEVVLCRTSKFQNMVYIRINITTPVTKETIEDWIVEANIGVTIRSNKISKTIGL